MFRILVVSESSKGITWWNDNTPECVRIGSMGAWTRCFWASEMWFMLFYHFTFWASHWFNQCFNNVLLSLKHFCQYIRLHQYNKKMSLHLQMHASMPFKSITIQFAIVFIILRDAGKKVPRYVSQCNTFFNYQHTKFLAAIISNQSMISDKVFPLH